MSSYTEYKTPQQSNINWGESFKMAVKAPLVADRIFATFQDAIDYVEDVNSSATAGLIISVINDGNNNGIYYVNYATPNSSFGDPLALYKDGAQSDFFAPQSSPSYIKHKINGNYGYFVYNNDGTISEGPLEEGFDNN